MDREGFSHGRPRRQQSHLQDWTEDGLFDSGRRMRPLRRPQRVSRRTVWEPRSFPIERASHNEPRRSAALVRRDRARIAELRDQYQIALREGCSPRELELIEELAADVRSNADRREMERQELDAQRWLRRQTSSAWNLINEPDWELFRIEDAEIIEDEVAETRLEEEERQLENKTRRQAESRDSLFRQLEALSMEARSQPDELLFRRPMPRSIPPRPIPECPGQAIRDRLSVRLERALEENDQARVRELTTCLTELRLHLNEGMRLWQLERDHERRRAALGSGSDHERTNSDYSELEGNQFLSYEHEDDYNLDDYPELEGNQFFSRDQDDEDTGNYPESESNQVFSPDHEDSGIDPGDNSMLDYFYTQRRLNLGVNQIISARFSRHIHNLVNAQRGGSQVEEVITVEEQNEAEESPIEGFAEYLTRNRDLASDARDTEVVLLWQEHLDLIEIGYP